YHDFQVNRPVVSTTEDGERLITWPTTTLTVATAPLSGRTIALVHGIEPSIHWRRYCAELLDIAEDLSAQWLITVGALLADVPHTRPIPVTVSCEDPDLAQTLDVSRGRYEGPTGIVGILQHQAQAHGLAALSVWAAVPHYVAHPPSPKATLALLHRLEQLLDEPIPLGDLPEEAAAWQTGVDELAAEDSDIAEYVHQLEQAKDTADLPEATGEAIAQEFERYLRRRDGGATS
ncbi:MAG: PAC2 family protein, partial [Micrococcales bacterium]|nr:PAC2 family protein [Micrococcales bacterium]